MVSGEIRKEFGTKQGQWEARIMANVEYTLDELWQEAWETAEEPTAEIFGNSETLPPDEIELVSSPEFRKLSRPARIQRLMEHRAAKGILPNYVLPARPGRFRGGISWWGGERNADARLK